MKLLLLSPFIILITLIIYLITALININNDKK